MTMNSEPVDILLVEDTPHERELSRRRAREGELGLNHR